MSNSQVITIEVWSDFVCPWCWIAKRRLEQALKHFIHRDSVNVVFRAFRISTHQPEPFKNMIFKKLGSKENADRLMKMVSEQAVVDKLSYNFDAMLLGDTLQAHALVKAIIDPQRRSNLIERLFQAAATNGLAIFEQESLKAIALDVGISQAVIDDAWQNERLESLVIQDEQQACRFGSGVPLLVFNSKVVVSGAHPAETILESLNSLLPQVSEGAPSCEFGVCK